MFRILSGIFVAIPIVVILVTLFMVFVFSGSLSENESGFHEFLWSVTGPLAIYAYSRSTNVNPGVFPLIWLVGLAFMSQHILFRRLWSLILALITLILWIFAGLCLISID